MTPTMRETVPSNTPIYHSHPLTLFLSLSHAHTYSPTHLLTHSLTHTLTHTLTTPTTRATGPSKSGHGERVRRVSDRHD